MSAKITKFGQILRTFLLGLIKKISIIGTGNVAFHLGHLLRNNGFNIHEVCGRTKNTTQELAQILNSSACLELGKMKSDADLYLVCVNDDSIREVLGKLSPITALVAHTSGNTPMNVFQEYGFDAYGVFYPLQTFSKKEPLPKTEIPFCIEANTSEGETQLLALARQLSSLVHKVDSNQRKTLHLAAVFACNFTNHMYHIAESIANNDGLDFELLKPLIQETAQKIKQQSPKKVQTGPAIRKDEATMQRHLEMLNDDGYRELYRLISESIQG